jgi:hypothetical protein
VGQGKTVGTILLGIALVALLVSSLWLVAAASNHETTTTGAVLGFALILIVLVLPLGGGGIYLMSRGRVETDELAEIKKEKTILNMVLTQGKVTLAEAALEVGAPRDKVEEYVRDLVGKGLFSGAINWKDGILYSKEAGALKADQKCPNCGGQVELAGKGIIKCPYCGAEIFTVR